MSWISDTLSSSIGRKVSMSLTGLFLVSFLFVHLSGNFLMFKNDGGDAFNVYTKFMSTNTLIRVLEIGLLVGFLLHIYTAFVLTRKNKAARPIGYAVPSNNPKVSWFSTNMGLSGSIVLVFLVIHLMNFYWKFHYDWTKMVLIDNEPHKDMYTLVILVFQHQWWYSLLYVVAMVLLGFHLNHGFQSAFRTLGVDHVKYTPIITGLGVLISILLPIGFAIFPIYYGFIQKFLN